MLEQLYILIIEYHLQIPWCPSRCYLISIIDRINPVYMYSQDLYAISGQIHFHCSNRLLYVHTLCQIGVSKMVFSERWHVSASIAMHRKQSPDQFLNEWFPLVAPSNKHSAVTSSVKWGVYAHRVK